MTAEQHVRVARGNPTEEELAALVVALARRTPPPASGTLDPWRLAVRPPGVRTRAAW